MKKITLILALTLLASFSFGQRLKKINVEPFLGITYPLYNISQTNNIIGPALGLEIRYNLKEIPIDIGGEFGVSVANRTFDDDNLALRNVSFSVVSDYNWKVGSKISHFVGGGLGVAFRHMTSPGFEDDPWGTKVAGPNLILRGGFCFFGHLRTSLEFRITNKRYNTLGLRIGYAF